MFHVGNKTPCQEEHKEGSRCVQHSISMQAINSQFLSRKIIVLILAEAPKILYTDIGFSCNQSVKYFRIDRGSNLALFTALPVEIKEGFILSKIQ